MIKKKYRHGDKVQGEINRSDHNKKYWSKISFKDKHLF